MLIINLSLFPLQFFFQNAFFCQQKNPSLTYSFVQLQQVFKLLLSHYEEATKIIMFSKKIIEEY